MSCTVFYKLIKYLHRIPLLNLSKKHASSLSEIDDKQQRLKLDNNQLSLAYMKLQENLKEAEHEVKASHHRERFSSIWHHLFFSLMLQKHRKEKASWDSEKEDLQRRIVMLQHKDTQYQVVKQCIGIHHNVQHEIRKKEKQYDILKERLQQLLAQKNKEAKHGMELLNSIQKTGKVKVPAKSGKAVSFESFPL